MTEPDKTRQESGLSQAQYNAIDAILAGATDQETAKRCGVSRQAVPCLLWAEPLAII